jgi:hypothetical protein
VTPNSGIASGTNTCTRNTPGVNGNYLWFSSDRVLRMSRTLT